MLMLDGGAVEAECDIVNYLKQQIKFKYKSKKILGSLWRIKTSISIFAW